ncbi:DUF4983 domain-containing protein [Chitinophaga sp. Mgbs1]|uniref:DUF4983 domain-containing protein n=1 Tax=Chitinophaga solisilvae TaxID=1233460 RepID=A0A9Q5D6S8_9BACT|nr:DUF4983 domain-containing protein [Chitinophaga solisilvae]
MRSISVKIISAAMILMAAACAKVALVPDDIAKQPEFKDKSKVLLIVVDGLKGSEMRRVSLPVISGMLPHSAYSFDAVTDSVSTDGAGWAAIMTATGNNKHTITDSSLTAKTQSGARYVSFLALLKRAGRSLHSVAVSGWPQLHKTLLADAGVKILTKDDDATVRDSAVNRLKKDNPDLLIVHFNGVNKAGISKGFDAEVPEYASAMTNADAYIGSIMDALKSRPDYANENWLTIVQSTHGGFQQSYGGGSEFERNGFSLYYNPDLKENRANYPQMIRYAVHMYEQGASAVNAVLTDNSAYNFGASGNYTIEAKVRTYTGGFTSNYPAFLSKRASFDGYVPGWCFFLEGSYWQINFGSPLLRAVQCKGADINDGKWHHLSAVISMDTDGKRWVTTYTDGVRNNRKDISALGDINTTNPLTMGFIPGSIAKPMDMYMNDVRIWNDSLPAGVIAQYSCTNEITDSHPYYRQLSGYWPCQEKTGTTLKNMAPGATGKNFSLKNTTTWDYLNYTLPCQANEGTAVVPHTKDVFAQIAYWLNVQLNSEWETEGRLWLKFF